MDAQEFYSSNMKNSTTSNVMDGNNNNRMSGLGESKIQYVRQMVYQYLTCKDIEVKPHIESALIALLRYNETERLVIEERKKMDTQDTLLTITNFLGSLTS